MSKVNWEDAPKDAEFYSNGYFRKNTGADCPKKWHGSMWINGSWTSFECLNSLDYEPRPTISLNSTEWPENDDRIDRIGRDRTTEDTGHYEQNEEELCNQRYVDAAKKIREALKAEIRAEDAQEAQQPKSSADFLSACLQVQSERGKQYDATRTGERSFQAAASAFNAVTGKDLKGSDICLILEMVKLVRQYSSPDRLHVDSVLDKVSYSSLWAEMLVSELAKDKEQ